MSGDHSASERSWPEISLPARIGLLGDFHGSSKRQALGLFLSQARPDVLLVAGDVQDYEPWPVPMIFVRGNHEHFTTIAALEAGTITPRNVHYLPDREIITVAGLRIAGIGGIAHTKPGPKRIDAAASEWLSRQGGIDIVVSHDAPIHYSDGRRELTNEDLRVLAEVVAPRLWLSGHHHWFDSEQLGMTTLISVGKWPHEWAVLDMATDATFTWSRFCPEPDSRYEARLPRWRQAALDQIASLSAAGAQ